MCGQTATAPFLMTGIAAPTPELPPTTRPDFSPTSQNTNSSTSIAHQAWFGPVLFAGIVGVGVGIYKIGKYLLCHDSARVTPEAVGESKEEKNPQHVIEMAAPDKTQVRGETPRGSHTAAVEKESKELGIRVC